MEVIWFIWVSKMNRESLWQTIILVMAWQDANLSRSARPAPRILLANLMASLSDFFWPELMLPPSASNYIKPRFWNALSFRVRWDRALDARTGYIERLCTLEKSTCNWKWGPEDKLAGGVLRSHVGDNLLTQLPDKPHKSSPKCNVRNMSHGSKLDNIERHSETWRRVCPYMIGLRLYRRAWVIQN